MSTALPTENPPQHLSNPSSNEIAVAQEQQEQQKPQPQQQQGQQQQEKAHRGALALSPAPADISSSCFGPDHNGSIQSISISNSSNSIEHQRNSTFESPRTKAATSIAGIVGSRLGGQAEDQVQETSGRREPHLSTSVTQSQSQPESHTQLQSRSQQSEPDPALGQTGQGSREVLLASVRLLGKRFADALLKLDEPVALQALFAADRMVGASDNRVSLLSDHIPPPRSAASDGVASKIKASGTKRSSSSGTTKKRPKSASKNGGKRSRPSLVGGDIGNVRDAMRSPHSVLTVVNLHDVLNFKTFDTLFSADEQNSLLPYMCNRDRVSADSVRGLFYSTQFREAVDTYQQALASGVLDVSEDAVPAWFSARKLPPPEAATFRANARLKNQWKEGYFEEYWGQRKEFSEEDPDLASVPAFSFVHEESSGVAPVQAFASINEETEANLSAKMSPRLNESVDSLAEVAIPGSATTQPQPLGGTPLPKSGKPKRKLSTFSDEQLIKLREVYALDSSPPQELRRKLALEFGLPCDAVTRYFRDRRRRESTMTEQP